MKNLGTFMLLVLCAQVFGYTTHYWDNEVGDRDFANVTNWDPDITAFGNGSSGTNVYVEVTGTSSPILASDVTARILATGFTAASGEVTITAGTSQFDNVILGHYGGSGTSTMTGGSMAVLGYYSVGGRGSGCAYFSGDASLHANRFYMGTVDQAGYMEIDDDAALSTTADFIIGSTSGGIGEFVFDGSSASLRVGDDLIVNTGSTLEFHFDGGNGVGDGIVVKDTADLSGFVDVSFIDSIVNGTYTVLTAGTINDLTSGALLSQTMIETGWSYEIVDNDTIQELQLTIPEPASISLLFIGTAVMAFRKK